jgi:hypothetical protein
MTDIDWATIHAGLIAPFDPAVVEFRPQGGLSEKGNGRALAYIDARAVMDRLDAVVGPENWYGFPDVLIADNAVRVVRYGLTIHGVTKYAIGDAADTEASKSADSDGLKRAAVPWGIGRYLYSLDTEWVKGEKRGGGWIIPDEELRRLRAKLGGATLQRAVVAQEPRNGREATPSTPHAANGTRPPAGAVTESPPPSIIVAGKAFRAAAAQAGYATTEAQDKYAREQYPGRGLSSLTADEWRALELKCRAMYSDVPAPEEAPIF